MYLIQPWKHQLQAIERAQTTPDLALFFEMGTGKTSTAINILRHHFARHKRVMRTLILAPVIVLDNWVREFGVHSKINSHHIVKLAGPGRARAQTFEAAAFLGSDPVGRIFVTNYEAMEMADLVELIHKWVPEILVCDESHRLKNPKSVRAKEVVKIADLCRHRYILTGSPILNSAMDVFNQFRILDGGKTFGTNFYEFRGRYFEDLNQGMPSHIRFPKWVPRPETYNDMNRLLARKSLRVLKSECLDLPPLIRTRVLVELSREQRRLYNEMRDEYITWIETTKDQARAVVAQMALTKILRLQQIVSGFVRTEDHTYVTIKQNPRLDALIDLLEDLTPTHKVIVWAVFHQNYKQIRDACTKRKIETAELHGGISAHEKTQALDRFRKTENCRVLIANQAAAGLGINLVEAAYSIFFSRNMSLEQDVQAESRNYRGGSEIHQKVTRIDLVADQTIDTIVLDALAQKQNISEQILRWNL